MKRGFLVTAMLLLLVALGSAGVVAADQQAAPAATPAQSSDAEGYRGGGCCGGPRDGWLLSALENADLDQLRAAFDRLDADADAKALLATPEAVTIRRIVETGKLPELSLEDWRKLERSAHTAKLIRALRAVLRVQRILTT